MTAVRFAATLLPLALAANLATAEELKFSSAAPPTSPWANQINRNAVEVDADTKGAVKMVPYFNSQLGGENDVIAQISRGRIDMGSFTRTRWPCRCQRCALLNLPFFFDKPAAARLRARQTCDGPHR